MSDSSVSRNALAVKFDRALQRSIHCTNARWLQQVDPALIGAVSSCPSEISSKNGMKSGRYFDISAAEPISAKQSRLSMPRNVQHVHLQSFSSSSDEFATIRQSFFSNDACCKKVLRQANASSQACCRTVCCTM